MYLEPKVKASLQEPKIQYPMEGFQSPSQESESSRAKCKQNIEPKRKDSNPRRQDSNLNSREFAQSKGFESHMDRIRISIPESLIEEKDSNL